jgi:integrase
VHGRRLRARIVVLWRADLRIHEALALNEADLNPRRGSVLVRRGRADAGVKWATSYPSDRCSAHQRTDPRTRVVDSGRTHPAPRHRCAERESADASCLTNSDIHTLSRWLEGVPLLVIQRQLGHTNLGITSIYLQGIDSAEIIDTAHARRPHTVPVNRLLRP